MAAPLALTSNQIPYLAILFSIVDVLMGFHIIRQGLKRINPSHHANKGLGHTKAKPQRRASIQRLGSSNLVVPDQDLLEQEMCMMEAMMIEQGNILGPILYLTAWTTIRLGPSSSIFNGVGRSDFGWQAPSQIMQVWLTVLLMCITTAIGGFTVHFYCLHNFDRNSLTAQGQIIAKHWLTLAANNIMAIYTIFCLLHMSCGLDISFKLDPILNPKTFFQVMNVSNDTNNQN